MPKIKTKKNKKLSSTSINFIILFIMVIMLLAGLYAFYYFYLKIKSEEIQSLAVSREELTQGTVVRQLDVTGLIEDGFYQLRQYGIMEFADQESAIPQSDSNPARPIDIQVINPKIGQEVILTWKKPDWAKYETVKIFRSTEKGRAGALIAEELPATGSYVDTDVQNNKAYFYSVVSDLNKNISGNNSQFEVTPTDELPPAMPNKVKLNTDENSRVVITWVNPDDPDFSHCRVYRSNVSGARGDKVADNVTEGKFIDEKVDDNVQYYYVVTALDNNGNESATQLAIAVSGNNYPFGDESQPAAASTP